MSEKTQPRAEVWRPTAELQFATISYEQLLDAVGSKVPEVDQKRDGLLCSAHELIQKFEVDESFFDCNDNALGLLLAAGLHNEALHRGDKTLAKRYSDRKIASNFARILFGDYSEIFPHEDLRKSTRLDDDSLLALHKKYENPELSQRLQEWLLTSPELEETRQTLMVNGRLQNFQTIVLGVGSPFHTKHLPDELLDYKTSLHRRGDDFMRERRGEADDHLSYAYTERIHGERYLCFMEPTVRILFEPEALGLNLNKELASQIKHLIEHELVHTQGRLRLEGANGKDSYIGKGLEECRADILSDPDDPLCYYDMLNAMSIVDCYAKFDITQVIQATGGTDKIAFYTTLMQATNLTMTAKLASLIPEKVIELESPKSSRVINAMLSGHQIIDHFVADMSAEQLIARINEIAKDNVETRTRLNQWLGDVWRAAHTSEIVLP